MSASDVQTWTDTWADLRRSVNGFLIVPAATIIVCMLLAGCTYFLDRSVTTRIGGIRELLSARLFTGDGSIDTLLATLAGGMMTLTSITFSMLLIAVQQSAGALTTQVLDQFMRRRLNQFYFGAFVGVSLHVLIVMATVETRATPVFSTLLALLLTCSALVLLILLMYTTLNQMRANRIVEAIHDLTLASRERQYRLLTRTRRRSLQPSAMVTRRVLSDNNGYVANLHLDLLAKAVGGRDDLEVEFFVSIGDYVCFHDTIAEIRAGSDAIVATVEQAVLEAIDLERQRNMHVDPGYGVTQLATIGWTSTSTALSNSSPALSCLRSLRDLAARWSEEQLPAQAEDSLPVVYRDRVLERVIDAFESIGVAASEAMQHRCCAEVLNAFSRSYARLPEELKPRAEDAVRRMLSSLGDHVLTADVDRALLLLVDVLFEAGRTDTAREVRTAHARLASTIGQLHSRGTRVSAG